MAAALDYAENVLGVHRTHDEAEALLKELDDTLAKFDEAVDQRRLADEKIENRQMDLLIEERGKHADLSQAAMDRRIKERYHTDSTLASLRFDRNSWAGQASGLELDIEYIKYRLKVKVARMEELGGYFQYLAAVKNAETSTSGQRSAAAGGEADTTDNTGATT